MKLKQISVGLIVMSMLLTVSCIKDDFFGLSNFKEIKAFQLPGQAGVSTINSEERTYYHSYERRCRPDQYQSFHSGNFQSGIHFTLNG
jgi:hypothetical protein